MSTVNVKGTLLNPANQVSPNTPIRLTSVLGYGDTLTSSTTVVTTDAVGDYDFDLVYGTHMIEVRFEDKYVKLDTVVIASGVGPLTINELLLSNTPLVPEYITTILQSLTEAREAADRAEEYAREALETGAMIEAGSVDLSGSVYPEPLKDLDGNNRACFWKVIVGGTVSGIVYGIGDSLVYSAETDSYYKIDNTESVTSVNGNQGVVVLNASDVGALPESATAVNSDKLDNIDSSGFQQIPVANIPAPLGGYLSSSGDQTGIARVTLPQGFTDTMVSFTVNVFDYGSGKSQQIRVSGYLPLNLTWMHSEVLLLSGTESTRVRLGYNGTKCCVYLGETTTNWSFIQISITDVSAGYSGNEPEKWSSGWQITTGATAENVDYDITLNDWDGTDYDDPSTTGQTGRTAKIYPDGSIVGSTDNGSYTKWANGDLECYADVSVDLTDLQAQVYYLPVTVVMADCAGVNGTQATITVDKVAVQSMQGYSNLTFWVVQVLFAGSTTSYNSKLSFKGRWK